MHLICEGNESVVSLVKCSLVWKQFQEIWRLPMTYLSRKISFLFIGSSCMVLLAVAVYSTFSHESESITNSRANHLRSCTTALRSVRIQQSRSQATVQRLLAQSDSRTEVRGCACESISSFKPSTIPRGSALFMQG